MHKVLWLTDGSKEYLIDRANYIRAQAICIRTVNDWLLGSVRDLKAQGFDVYAWRWPSVDPTADTNHHYADSEAQFAKQLISEGLDGYIVDPEQDNGRDSDDWNQDGLEDLAASFCDTIKLAGRKANPRFLFGTTSGCNFPITMPSIPWSVFIAHSDAVYPQIYWAPNFITAKQTTPDAAYKSGMDAWGTVVPQSVPIVPILGDIATNKPTEIDRFGQILVQNGHNEVHVYTCSDNLDKASYGDTWDAVRRLGTTPVA